MIELPAIFYVLSVVAIFLFIGGCVYSLIVNIKQQFENEKEFRNIKNVALTDSMDDYVFEEFVAFLYKNQGYKAEVTPKGNDVGIDVVMEKGGKKILVQVKHYRVSNKIGRVDLQKFVGSYLHLSDEGFFVTSSSFNKNAVEYAKSIPSLTLVNRADLGDMIEKLPDDGWQMRFLLPK